MIIKFNNKRYRLKARSLFFMGFIVLLVSVTCFLQIDQERYFMNQTEVIQLPETTIQAVEIQETPITDQERSLVWSIVAAEARGESIEAMRTVALTIHDRSEFWQQSITDVCLQPGQYASPYQGAISAEVQQAVADVFDNNFRTYEEITTHFHDDSVDPYWAASKTSRGTIGRMTFYGGDY